MARRPATATRRRRSRSGSRKELKDFARVPLAPGEATTVALHLTPEKLGHYRPDGTFVVQPGEFRVMVGSSSRDEDLETVILEVNP